MIHLYVKTHNVTGLKYFGKTSGNPFTYKGSGKYWLRHLKVHGNDVSTEVVATFNDSVKAKEFALAFSRINDVVASDEWANLKLEELDGGWTHINQSSEKSKICKAASLAAHQKHPLLWMNMMKGIGDESRTKALQTVKQKFGTDYFSKISAGPKTKEHKDALSASLVGNKNAKGAVRMKFKCPHCVVEGAKNVMVRFHFDKCKARKH